LLWKDEADNIKRLAEQHNNWFEESFALIASENLLSPLAAEMLVTDLHNRYAEGLPGNRYYQGNVYVDEIEIKVTELAKKLFDVNQADVRPISGTNANTAILFALTNPGDTIGAVPLPAGAHISSAKFGAVGLRGVNTFQYPFDVDEMNIKVDETAKMIIENKPKVCLFGQSVFLFPTPLMELEDAFQEVGCKVWYDGAHVLGLIGGGEFQSPLKEGAHLISGSTHKTLPGPQRGIILGNTDEDTWKKVQRRVFPGVISNHHLNTMAALGIALAEHLEYGKDYARQTIKNAQKLGEYLHESGIDVLASGKGFTASHTIVVDVQKYGGGKKVAENLEKANIIVNKNMLPWDDNKNAQNPSGLRLGAQELTRLGMKESDIVEIGNLISRVIKGENPIKVKEDVKALKKDFCTIQYCFSKDTNPYKYTLVF